MTNPFFTRMDSHGEDEKPKMRIFTPIFYFLLWCCSIVSQSMLVSGFLNVVLSTLQVEYQLNSAEAAMFPSSYDITVAVTVLLVSHFGSSHKPRTLGLGMLFMAVGSCLFALPNFIYTNTQEAALEDFYLCDTNNTRSTDCDNNMTSRKSSGAYAMLLLGSIFIGLGAAPVYTAGMSIGFSEVSEMLRIKLRHLYL